METKGQLTLSQVAFITFASAAGNIVYTFTFVTALTGRPFWVAEFIGVVSNIPLAIWILYLGNRLQGDTIFDILQDGIGKILTKILIVIFYAINIAGAVCMLVMFTGTLQVFFLQRTPSFIIMLFLVVICAVFVSSGLKTAARLIEILSILYTINFFLGFFLSFFKLFKVEYILPIFDTNSLQFLKGVLVTTGGASECLLPLMVIMGYVPKMKKQYLSVVKGIASWSLFLMFGTFIFEGDIGHELLSRIAQAGITVARVIQIQNFIRGLEILILMTYQYFCITKITSFLYCCYASAQKLFQVKKSSWLLIISAALIFFGSVWVNSFNAAYYYALILDTYIVLPFSLLLLILGTLCLVIKKVKDKIHA